MNTPTNDTVELHELLQGVHPEWAQVLKPHAETLSSLEAALAAEHAKGNRILPAKTDILRAFTYPMHEVKVLIVGQDPYPTPGHAMGLSFSVAPGVRIPASLKNIFTEMHSDLGTPFPHSGDLRPWAEQGVMLLNRVLTVRAGQAASHRTLGWQHITDAAVCALVQRALPLVAILWGADAQRLKPLLADTPCICSVHPSPLSAYRGFFGSRPFSRTNELLAQAGAKPIDWRLP